MDRKGILLVVSGFSGAGKGTLMKELVSRYDNYALSISATTRSPREGEQRVYFTAIRKILAEPVAEVEAEGEKAEARAKAEFAADAEMETL